jgi:hypothetical protein
LKSNHRGKHGLRRSKTSPERKTLGQSPTCLVYGPEVTHLRSSPFVPSIDDPAKEKGLIEKHGTARWRHYLLERLGKEMLISHPTDESKRIAEIYRLCFLNSGSSDASIVGDFAAHFPGLVFQCEWVRKLVAECARVRHVDENARRLLLAIASGFRRAGAKPNWERLTRTARIQAARDAQKELRRILATWVRECQPSQAVSGWWREKVNEKVLGICRAYSRFPEDAKPRLKELLEKKRTYEASVLIAARTFNVRERDLQTSAASS